MEVEEFGVGGEGGEVGVVPDGPREAGVSGGHGCSFLWVGLVIAVVEFGGGWGVGQLVGVSSVTVSRGGRVWW